MIIYRNVAIYTLKWCEKPKGLFLQRCSFRCHILKQISDRVAFGLERCGAPRHTGGRLRVNAGRVIDKVGVKAALLDLLGREIAR